MDKRRTLIDRMLKRGYKLIENDVFNIANRIRKYDKDLVLFFNPYRGAYEVHTSFYITTSRPTYCVSSDSLDYSLILKLKRADNRTEYGFREKLDDIEKSYDQEEKSKQKEYENIKEDILKRCEKEFFSS